MSSSSITILIVVRNAEKFIKDILISIVKQNIKDNDLEVLIVDGLSNDNTVKVAEELLNENKISYRIIRNYKKSLAPGWNLGIKNAKGNYIIRPDAHAKLENNYIQLGIKKLENNKELAAVGGVLETKANTFIGRLITKVLTNPIGVGASSFRIGVKEDTFTDTAVYAVYRKRIFDEIGLFNENLERNQDIDFHKRVKKAGYKFLTSPEMKASYFSRTSLSKYLIQGFNNGFWVTFGRGGHFRHKIPMYFVTSIFILLLFSLKYVGIVLVFYLLTILFSFIIFSKEFSPIKLFILMFLTFSLHLSYGIGSILGLMKLFIPK